MGIFCPSHYCQPPSIQKAIYASGIGSTIAMNRYHRFKKQSHFVFSDLKLLLWKGRNPKLRFLFQNSKLKGFLTAILHRGLRNDFFFLQPIYFFPFSIWTFTSLFFMDFYFPFLFGHLFPFSIWNYFPFSIWTFISLLYLDISFPSNFFVLAHFNSF